MLSCIKTIKLYKSTGTLMPCLELNSCDNFFFFFLFGGVVTDSLHNVLSYWVTMEWAQLLIRWNYIKLLLMHVFWHNEDSF